MGVDGRLCSQVGGSARVSCSVWWVNNRPPAYVPAYACYREHLLLSVLRPEYEFETESPYVAQCDVELRLQFMDDPPASATYVLRP